MYFNTVILFSLLPTSYGFVVPQPLGVSKQSNLQPLNAWWPWKKNKSKPVSPEGDSFVTYPPSKEMTDLEPDMARLCATLSHQLYSAKEKDDLKLSTKEMNVEPILFDDHGDLKEGTPPFGVLVSGTTMVIGWRGSSSATDFLNDAALSPQSSLATRKYKGIKLQGAFSSIVQNDFVLHEETIINEIQKRGITEIITTGHSLGGGAAQVAHVMLRAQIQDESSPWSVLQGVDVRSFNICGPMTIASVDEKKYTGEAVLLKAVAKNSCTLVFKDDVVPRGYAYLSFIDNFIDDVTKYASKQAKGKLPGVLIKRVLPIGNFLDDLTAKAEDNEKVQGLIQVAQQYYHPGKIIYYKSETAVPVVLRDTGAFDTMEDDETSFRYTGYKYSPTKTPIEDEIYNHGYLKNGPGLSYGNDELLDVNLPF